MPWEAHTHPRWVPSTLRKGLWRAYCVPTWLCFELAGASWACVSGRRGAAILPVYRRGDQGTKTWRNSPGSPIWEVAELRFQTQQPGAPHCHLLLFLLPDVTTGCERISAESVPVTVISCSVECEDAWELGGPLGTRPTRGSSPGTQAWLRASQAAGLSTPHAQDKVQLYVWPEPPLPASRSDPPIPALTGTVWVSLSAAPLPPSPANTLFKVGLTLTPAASTTPGRA